MQPDTFDKSYLTDKLCSWNVYNVLIADSSGESDSSDDSDIEGETTSALFMVCVFVLAT